MGDSIVNQAENLATNEAFAEVKKFFLEHSDQVLESGADFFAEKLALKIATRNETLGKAAYMVSNYAILEVAENIFHVGSGINRSTLSQAHQGFTERSLTLIGKT